MSIRQFGKCTYEHPRVCTAEHTVSLASLQFILDLSNFWFTWFITCSDFYATKSPQVSNSLSLEPQPKLSLLLDSLCYSEAWLMATFALCLCSCCEISHLNPTKVKKRNKWMVKNSGWCPPQLDCFEKKRLSWAIYYLSNIMLQEIESDSVWPLSSTRSLLPVYLSIILWTLTDSPGSQQGQVQITASLTASLSPPSPRETPGGVLLTRCETMSCPRFKTENTWENVH